jgi:hypothetical protein
MAAIQKELTLLLESILTRFQPVSPDYGIPLIVLRFLTDMPVATETFSLISHLTEVAPQVASFSADGGSFEVYDQTTLSNRYLSQYFKHNNWGSFVRQLNLYGFTSSRLKERGEVIIWSHELFHRDHMEWLPNIKRTKKAKKPSSKGADPIDRPSSSSPQSFCDVQNEATFTSADREWLQSEFASVKQQNRLIEEQNRALKERLDFLIKYTVKVDFSDGAHPGAKRPRSAADYSSDIAPTPLSDRAFHQDPDDSLKSFIDVMLAENPNEESKELVDDEYLEGRGSLARDHHRRDSHSMVASIINSLGSESGKLHSLASRSQDVASIDRQDDLTPPNQNVTRPRTEWVPNANRLDDKAAGPELVYSTQDAPPVTASSIIDADEDKVPEWVNLVPPDQSVTDEYRRSSNTDEEQGGGHFADLTLVSAHLVESERGITLDNSAAQIIASQQQQTRQLSKRVMCAVVILVIVAIVSLTSTIIITNHEAPEMSPVTEDSDDVHEYENVYAEKNEGVATAVDLPIREDVEADHLNADTAVSEQEDATGNSNPLESGSKTSTLSSSASSADLNDYESSSDYSPSGISRRWKDLDMTDEYIDEISDNIFDWHPPDMSKHNVTDQVLSDATDLKSLPSDKGELTFTELSLTINGGVETFRCYHQ